MYSLYICCFHKSPEFSESNITFKVSCVIIPIVSSNWLHSHDIHQKKPGKYRNHTKLSTVKTIKDQTTLGLSSGAIRIKNKLTISPGIFYDIRRPELLIDREYEIESLNKELTIWKNRNIFF